jgi:hypothetical protein
MPGLYAVWVSLKTANLGRRIAGEPGVSPTSWDSAMKRLVGMTGFEPASAKATAGKPATPDPQSDFGSLLSAAAAGRPQLAAGETVAR